jgi:hypothetical protein
MAVRVRCLILMSGDEVMKTQIPQIIVLLLDRRLKAGRRPLSQMIAMTADVFLIG